MFKRKKKKNNAGKIRRARVKNIRKIQEKQTRANKRSITKRKKQKKKINWKKVGVFFLIFCFLSLVVWVIFFSGVMKINNIEIIGYQNKIKLKTNINILQENKLINKISQNNLVIFPKAKLIDQIKQENIDIKNVTVSKIFPNKLQLKIEKRQELFLWKQQDKCQLLDEDVNLIQQIQCKNGAGEALNICEEKKKQIGLNCLVVMSELSLNDFSEEELNKIIKNSRYILKGMQKTFYFDEDLVIIIPALILKEIKVRSEKYGEVWFSLENNNIKKQLGKFRALLEKKITINNLNNMQYIDLRLDNKIIYKFKEGFNKEELLIKD